MSGEEPERFIGWAYCCAKSKPGGSGHQARKHLLPSLFIPGQSHGLVTLKATTKLSASWLWQRTRFRHHNGFAMNA
jgi:hypothetical protein